MEKYKHFNKDAKALTNPPLYIKIKLYILIGYNKIK